jgi:hypothetical protein
MKRTFVSAVTAACLTLGTAGAINVASALVAPTTAHAGVLGTIKGAAKSVGSAAKTVGKTVGKGAAIGGKAVGKAAVVTGKAVGQRVADVGVGTARNAAYLGKQIARTPVGDAARGVGSYVKQTYRRIAN